MNANTDQIVLMGIIIYDYLFIYPVPPSFTIETMIIYNLDKIFIAECPIIQLFGEKVNK